ncbi:MAG: hypothetical protein CVU90_10260 [Firmicutes bacterium HGW-Firmicutes-15]|nr:MAG: hypothetical protein CVU90_10260 [Firmicutes bacterium HGW-Firmicutes-15]
MKKRFVLSTFLCVAFLFTMTTVASAWSYSDYSHGTYVPKQGDLERAHASNWFTTEVTFGLDSTNVTNILDYNNGGDNPGTVADNKKCYLTLDQTAKPENVLDLEISAYSIASNLPDPKFDLEINYVGVDVDESEVVALGSVSAQSYYMSTVWNDYRDGGSNDGGRIQAQFAMSAKGFSDYNNVVQETTYYGDNLGQW